MNYAIPTVILLVLGTTTHAQNMNEADVPQPVKAAFMERFPKAQGATWEMEGKKDHEVNFTQDATRWSATFAPDGKWLGTEHIITIDALPASVRSTIATKYADHRLKEAEQADTPKGRQYELELEKDGRTTEVVLSADGAVLKSKVEKEEQDGQD